MKHLLSVRDLDRDTAVDYLGRIAYGRILSGRVSVSDSVVVIGQRCDGEPPALSG